MTLADMIQQRNEWIETYTTVTGRKVDQSDENAEILALIGQGE